jgi:glucan endo-1,3-alpha-glucosidase
VTQVVDLINRYKTSKAQMLVDGDPFVSTFEGPGWAGNWSTVRQETGGIFLIPDWSSIGPYGVGEKLDMIDGACRLHTLTAEHSNCHQSLGMRGRNRAA